jgi:RNA polymerase sigma factor (sigma-70 family)
LATGGKKQSRTRRDYRPVVEGLEALRLLSEAAQAHPLAAVAAHHDFIPDPAHPPLALGELGTGPSVSSATWDAALDHAPVAALLASPATTAPGGTTSAAPAAASATSTERDDAAMASGLSQLNKYLNRAWYRAGIPAQLHDDSSQSVYATLLASMGRQRFESLVIDVGHAGVRQVFSRESSDGPAFFRAVDMVKKRALREKVHQSLEAVDVPAATNDQAVGSSRRAALQEAIAQTLSPREADLIQNTLMGMTPAEIALEWGIAPKTVSNEKARILQKLRVALGNHEMN